MVGLNIFIDCCGLKGVVAAGRGSGWSGNGWWWLAVGVVVDGCGGSGWRSHGGCGRVWWLAPWWWLMVGDVCCVRRGREERETYEKRGNI